MLKNHALQAAKREHVELLSNLAAANSAARDTTKQIAAVKAETAKLEHKIEDAQQGMAATEVTSFPFRHALLPWQMQCSYLHISRRSIANLQVTQQWFAATHA